MIGMLLFLVKHSRPDIVNETREFFMADAGANPAAIKELLMQKNLGLKIEPTWKSSKHWEIVCFSDSDLKEIQ